jgi:hypothetical protein
MSEHETPPPVEQVAGIPTHPVAEEAAAAVPQQDHVPGWAQEILKTTTGIADTLAGLGAHGSENTGSGEAEVKADVHPVVQQVEPVQDRSPVKPPWTHRRFGRR